MEYFNDEIFSLSRKQLDASKANVRNSRRSEAGIQTEKCLRRNVLTHFLSPKLYAASSLVVICALLQLFHLCLDNGDIGSGLNFGYMEGRNLSQNNGSNRPGDGGRNRERKQKSKETFLNLPHVEEKQESGGCRYEEIETILGGSHHSNENHNTTYYVTLPEDQSKEESEDQSKEESEDESKEESEDEFKEESEDESKEQSEDESKEQSEDESKEDSEDESEVESEGSAAGVSRESEEHPEYSDEEQDRDEDDYEENEMLSSGKGVSGFGESRKENDQDFLRLDTDEAFSEDSDTDTESREMLTEEELNRRIKGLRGNLDDAEMLYLLNSFQEIEKKKFQVMIRHLWQWCELLAFEYKIPEDPLLTEWKKIVEISSDALMRKTVSDYRDFKKLVNEGLTNSMDFVYFLNSKRKTWDIFRSKTETVWKNIIDNKFRNYYN
ncbi:hypothetical protein C922_05279 [Plasmodium inui San Antonio 1]|uniref:Plasmodium RESA N-terminal domain-containing protein n=1 Tax=Plasmodium inui San Antonio 1 TaxID=1237626 RepID=W6ZYG3_9APIC|nr:hypothetical protein C922_05279 [Plasmodium inui San Antonio 1]EUD64340.1 hypothetical protein C922_05279 [Plasmodium inui San Antonio 1]